MQLADLGRLVEHHHGAVVAVAFATTRDLALAEDIAQETFIAAWDARATLRDEARVRSWLCGIARNISRNALRGRRRESGEAGIVTDDKPSVLDRAIDEERQRELRAALADVPDDYREPLVLYYWEDRSIAQVASALGVSEEAAQKRISRARGMLRAELEGPLESAGRARRSAAAAAAAVLAVLATRTGAAGAASATKGSTMSVIKGAGVLAVGGLVVGAIVLARGSSGASSTAAPAAPAEARREQVATTPPPELPAPAPPARPVEEHALAAAHGELPVPNDGYEITAVSPTSVAVELAGGKSNPSPAIALAPPKPVRHVTGRVLDDAGKPVAGAVVLVGERIDAFMGAFHAAGAAKTDAAGAFSVATHEQGAGYALALHPRAWSNVARVPAGRTDVAIALTAAPNGSIALHVTRAGGPREADVVLALGAGVRMSLQTDATGELRVPLLAPGSYRVDVRPAHGYLGGTSPAASRDVVVERGRTADLQVALGTGSKLLVSAGQPGMFTVEYFLYTGTDVLALPELRKRGSNGDIVDILYGGVDAERQAEIHDVAPGTYTLCVDAATREAHRPLACRSFEVTADTPPTLELAVDVTP